MRIACYALAYNDDYFKSLEKEKINYGTYPTI